MAEVKDKAILASLVEVQRNLHVDKGQTNKFGGYNYRSAEDIIEKAKPLCIENGLLLTTTDEIQQVGDRIYVVVYARVTDIVTGEFIEVKAPAREPSTQKGQSESQLTGTAESYAKKRALGNLFGLDDTKDPDTDEYRKEANGRDASQTSQNRAGARSQQNAGNYTNQPQGRSQEANELAEHGKAMQAVMQAAKAGGITNEQVKAVIKGKYGKAGSRELSVGQLQMLAHNLTQYVQEVGA